MKTFWSLEEFTSAPLAPLPGAVRQVQSLEVPAIMQRQRPRTHDFLEWDFKSANWFRRPGYPKRFAVPPYAVTLVDATTNARGAVHVPGLCVGGSALMVSKDVESARGECRPGHEAEIEEAVLLTQPGDHVFGHQLLDLMPRVQLALHNFGDELPFLVSANAAQSFTKLLRFFRMRARIIPISDEGQVLVRRLHLLTGARADDVFDPRRLLWLSESCTEPPETTYAPARVWITRADIPHRVGSRTVLNRTAVDNAALLHDFYAIAPERMPMDAVARLCMDAQVIAGEDGSGLHNCIFARPGTTLLVVGLKGFQRNIHLSLAQELGIRFAFLPGEPVTIVGEEHLYARDRSWFVPASRMHMAMNNLDLLTMEE